ncbi:MAG: multicopper oxidase family protein [Proteobacteria bacterium]|nr:multicopper oxidase family protein [Pseudomonadota bacterium]
MIHLNRRQLLTSAAAGVFVAASRPAWAANPVLPGVRLRIQERQIVVGGKSKTVFGILQPDGKHGIILGSRDRFRVELTNALKEPTLVHWHGQEPPAAQDGVPELAQSPLLPGGVQLYDFEPHPGTHWMHSHVGFQEQDMLSAPLIVRTADDERADMQEVVMFLHDFSFDRPEAILTSLGGVSSESGHAGHSQATPAAMANMPGMSSMPGASSMPGMPNMPNMPGMANMPGKSGSPGASSMPGMNMAEMKADLNDINYDAYLANDRTFDDPDVVRVEAGGRVRLRIINAAAATNFFIDLGTLSGRVIAVDGDPVTPVGGRLFPLGIAQRIDIVVELPRGEGAWPIVAQREGEKERTGIILSTARGTVARVAGTAPTAAGAASESDFEARLVATEPLAERAADRTVTIKLAGTMSPYAWTMGTQPSGENRPIEIRYGERVALVMRNDSMMAHPMHLHGHHFQVVEFGSAKIRGATRDTVLVPPGKSVTVVFDAVNPGRWAFHCHTLYHQTTGMMSEVRYIA